MCRLESWARLETSVNTSGGTCSQSAAIRSIAKRQASATATGKVTVITGALCYLENLQRQDGNLDDSPRRRSVGGTDVLPEYSQPSAEITTSSVGPISTSGDAAYPKKVVAHWVLKRLFARVHSAQDM